MGYYRTQEELIERFEEEHIMALFVTLASSSMDNQLAEWNALTLETFFYIFEGVDPDDLIPMVSVSARTCMCFERLVCMSVDIRACPDFTFILHPS